MAERELARGDVGPDVKLRLDAAARLAFPDGSITLSSLRCEAKKGRLTIWRIANKDMTTLAEIDRMVERCRVSPRRETAQEEDRRAATVQRAEKLRQSTSQPPGTNSSARAALRKTLAGLTSSGTAPRRPTNA